MKNGIIPVLIMVLVSSCFFKNTIKINDLVAKKQEIDFAENPAKKFLINKNLRNNEVVIKDVLVKEITASTNIDYDFCIIVDLTVDKKKIECYIYTSNVNKISELLVGKSRIDVEGEFSRFFVNGQYFCLQRSTEAAE